MLRIVNTTPFRAGLMPGTDTDGTEHAVVVIKGTFPLPQGGGRGPDSIDEVPLNWADTHHGEPDKTSIKYAGDAALRKPGTDVYLVVTAHSPRGKVKMLDASVEIGSTIKKTVRVVGDRRWSRSLGSWRASDPQPFESMPLIYERAFGGWAPGKDGSAGTEYEPRNPVGVGFAGKSPASGFEGTPLPNVEDPRDPIASPKDRPAPAGFGAIGRSWEQRAKWAGTMDDAWKEGRCPLLPVDFDTRYYQVAHPDLICPTHLQGGEPVRLTNLTPTATEVFALPRHRFEVTARIKGQDSPHAAVMDTVLIEPEARRFSIGWRATIPCARDFLLIDFLRIAETR